jgi:peroxiredoxin
MALTRKFINVMFVLLLVSTLCVSAPRASAGEFPASAEQITPLKAGDSAPAFTVETVENEPFDFDPASLRRPVVLISFRGGWCPYCNMHLSELRTVIPDIRAMGFDVLFISNDRPELLYSSLKDQTQEDIEGLDYTILSDADLNAASAFGTAFRRSDALVNYREEKGKDYAGSSIANHGALAVPSVYVIDKDGLIVFDFVNADYKVRLPADEVLAAAQRYSSK